MQSYLTISSTDADGKTSVLVDGLTSSDTTITSWGRVVSVNTIEMNKELYNPNYVKVQLQIGTEGDAISMNSIQKDLLGANLSVWHYPVVGTEKISKYDEYKRKYMVRNYPIHKVQPVFGAELKVNIIAYSPDIQLTYDKFSSAWNGKRFAKEVVQGTMEKTFNMKNVLNAKNLCHLRYDTTKELIQPYLVQYNESFYDFMRRVAYRCGEYLYWENDMLNLGLFTQNSDSLPCLTFSECVAEYSFQSDRKIQAAHRNIFDEVAFSTDKKSDKAYATGLAYYEGNSSISYFDQIHEYDKNYKDYWKPKAQMARYVSGMLKKGNLADMALFITTNVFKDMTKAGIKDKKEKEKYNYKNNFDNDGKQVRESMPDQYAKIDDKLNFTLYSSIALGSTMNLTADFYQKMQQGIRQVSGTRMTVILDTTDYQHVGLGDIIKLNNMDGSYVVVRVYRTENAKDVSYSIDVVTYDKDCVFPPMPRPELSFPLTREGGSQTAFVAQTGDPLKMGRVRVRFPWQKVKDDTTPWIRMSSQMASKDSGFLFEPQEGDEVLINFVGDNIEDPYVAGCLYAKGHVPTTAGTRSITSVNGHSIIFNDPKNGSGWSFLNEFFPISSLIANAIDKDNQKIIKEKNKQVYDDLKNIKAENGVISDDAKVDTKTDQGLKNIVLLQKKLELCRKFYAEAVCKPKGLYNVVPYTVYQPLQYDWQYKAAKERLTDKQIDTIPDEKLKYPDNFDQMSETEKADWKKNAKQIIYLNEYLYICDSYDGLTKLKKMKNFISFTASLLHKKEGLEKQKDVKQTEIDKLKGDDGKIPESKKETETKLNEEITKLKGEIAKLDNQIKNKEYEFCSKFYQEAIDREVTWNHLLNDNNANKEATKQNYIKNAQFLMHKYEVMKSLTKKDGDNWRDVIDTDWTTLSDDDWTNTNKVTISPINPVYNVSFQDWGTDLKKLDAEYKKNATDKQDCAIDERWFIPQLPTDEKSGENLLDRLKTKIDKLAARLKGMDLPTKSEDCSDGAYKNYLKHQEELKKVKDEKPFSLGKSEENFTGGITMTDTLGLYKIAMDAAKRNISISSPVGDVKIDAFSGISIEAPTGDVTIKGKNITLEAGNNIKIVSGKNKSAKTAKDSLKDLAAGLVKDTAVSVIETAISEESGWSGGIVDLKTVRLVYECIITPVEGTLQIHSGNNLILESNDANAHLPMADINQKSNRNEIKKSRLKALNLAVDHVSNQEKFLKNLLEPLEKATNSLKAFVSRTAKFNGRDVETVSQRYFNKTVDEYMNFALKAIIGEGTQLKKTEKFKETDYKWESHFGEDYSPTKQDKLVMKNLADELNKVRTIAKNYFDSVNQFESPLKDALSKVGAEDVYNSIKDLYPLKDAGGVILKIKDQKLAPADAIATLQGGLAGSVMKEKRNTALLAIAKAMVNGKYSDSALKAYWQGIGKDIAAWFGSDFKPVAEYVNPVNPIETLDAAAALIKPKTTTEKEWSDFISRFNKPDEGKIMKTLKDALEKLIGDLTGLKGMGGEVQTIISDTVGMSAQKTGKFLVAIDGDSTVSMEEDGRFQEVTTGPASLKTLKKKLTKGFQKA